MITEDVVPTSIILRKDYNIFLYKSQAPILAGGLGNLVSESGKKTGLFKKVNNCLRTQLIFLMFFADL
jgi:hypothetical protein